MRFLAILCLCLVPSLVSSVAGQPVEDLPSLVERVKHAVVTVETFDRNGERLGSGSGFFIDGLTIVTNAHVIQGATSAVVVKSDGTRIDAKGVVANNGVDDVVFVEIAPGANPKELLTWGAECRMGERVFVVGSPRGLQSTLSDGLSSGVREVGGNQYLQFSAPISPGSSGCPVLNMKCEVVGVATLMRRDSQNLNFAVPSTISAKLQRGPLLALSSVKREDLDSSKPILDIPEDPSIWEEVTPGVRQIITARAKDIMRLPNGVFVDAYRANRIREMILLRENQIRQGNRVDLPEDIAALGMGSAELINAPSLYEPVSSPLATLDGWLLVGEPYGSDARNIIVEQVLSADEVLASSTELGVQWVHVIGQFLERPVKGSPLRGPFFLEPLGDYEYVPVLGARRKVSSFRLLYPAQYELTPEQLAHSLREGNLKLFKYRYTLGKGARLYTRSPNGSTAPAGYGPAPYRWDKTPLKFEFRSKSTKAPGKKSSGVPNAAPK